MHRRSFLTGLIAAFAAPAIVRPGILMPIKPALIPVVVEPDKLFDFTRELNREFVRKNLFSPYMGEGLDAIIRVRQLVLAERCLAC